MNRGSKEKPIISIVIMAIMIAGISYMPSVSSADTWHNSSYDNRKWINVTNSSVMTGFQVLVEVIYDSDMQADFDDVKFYDIKGNRLDYWLQNKIDSTKAWFWIETSYDTIYMYYKNNTLSAGISDSNGFNTFAVFDNWEDGDDSSLTSWSNGTVTGTPPEAVVESLDGSYVYNISAHPNDELSRKAGTIPTSDHVIGGSFYSVDEYASGSLYPTRIGTFEDTSNWVGVSLAQYDDDIDIGCLRGGVWQGWVQHTSSADPVLSDSAWFTVEIVRNDSGTTTATWLSSGKDNVTGLKFQGTSTNVEHDVNGSLNLFTARGTVSWDDVYVRKYMSPEPSVSFGPEEINGGDSSPTTTLNIPSDASTDNDGSVTFNCSCIDDINITSIELWHNGTGTWASNMTNTTTSVTFSQIYTTIDFGTDDRTVEWNCICTDNSSQTDWANANRTVSIDAIPPDFRIHSPDNTTYNITNLDVDEGEVLFPLFLSVSECDTVLYNLDGGTNYTFTANTTVNGSIGTNKIDIYCNDSMSRETLKTIYFTINDTYTVSESSYATGYHSISGGSIGDANNDGDNEIIFGDVAGNGDPELYVGYWSGGDYTFSVASSDVAGDTTSWVAGIRFIDMDEDGNTDIVFHTTDKDNNAANLRTTIMNLSGYSEDQSNIHNWRDYISSSSESYPHGLATGNLTGNGKPTLFTGFCGGGDYDLYNITYTSTNRHHIYDFTETATTTSEGDLNNDGVLTAIGTVGVWSSTQQLIDFRFNSDYTLAEMTWIWNESSEGTEDLEVCDLDGDGINELVASFSYDQDQASNYVAAYKWNDTISGYNRYFVDERIYGTNGTVHGNYTNYYASACADIDNDGKDEFIVGSQVWNTGTQTVYVYMYQFDEEMTATRNILAKNSSSGWLSQRMNWDAFGDLDNDGDDELVIFRTVGHSEEHIYDGTNYMVVINLSSSNASTGTTPDITIYSPTNTTYSTTSISLNVDSNDTMDTWWYQHNSNGTNYTFTPNITITGTEGQNHIQVWSNDSSNNIDTETVYFTVDTTPPTITINTPVNTSYNNDISISVTTSTADACVYNLDGGSNTSLSGGPTSWSGTISSGSLSNDTTYNLITYCNDSYSNYGMNNSIWFTYLIMDAWYYNYTIVYPANGTNFSETETITFEIETNFNNSVYESVTQFIYINGTMFTSDDGTYGGSQTGYSEYTREKKRFEYKFPQITATSEDYVFLWELRFRYNNLSWETPYTNTTNTTITIYKIVINDTEPDDETLHFIIYDEETDSEVASDFEISFNITIDNTTERNYPFDLNGSTNYSFYIWPYWAGYWADAVIEYWADGYATRTWYLDDSYLTNSSQTINLYLSSDTNSSLVQINVRDSNYNEVPDVIIEIQRYDVGTETYKTITILKTDTEGKALTYLIPNSVDYKFILKQDGETVKTYGPMKVVDDGSVPIIVDLYISGILGEYYQMVDGVSGRCDFDNSTNVSTCYGYDTNGLVQNWCMIVKKIGILAFTEIANNCTTGTSIELSYNFSDNSTGQYTIGLYATYDIYDYLVATDDISFTDDPLYGNFGVFIAFLMCLVFIIIGLAYPPAGLIFATAGLIFAMAMQLIILLPSSIISLLVIGSIILFRGRGK